MQLTWPLIWMLAFPVVPAPPVVMPTTPPVSEVEAMMAVEGAPVSFVRVLAVVPVVPSLAMVRTLEPPPLVALMVATYGLALVPAPE